MEQIINCRLKNYGHLVRIPIQISKPPSRKLTQKEPMSAEIKKAAPAQSRGRHSTRLQNIKPPPSAASLCGERRCLCLSEEH